MTNIEDFKPIYKRIGYRQYLVLLDDQPDSWIGTVKKLEGKWRAYQCNNFGACKVSVGKANTRQEAAYLLL